MNVLCFRIAALAGLLAAAATLAGLAAAQPCSPDEVAKLLAGDGAAGDQFGFSVSVSGDTAVIGHARMATTAISPARHLSSDSTG